jgi:uncharacterized protein YkwD
MRNKLVSCVLLTLAASLLFSATATADSGRAGHYVESAPPVFAAAEVAPAEVCPNQTNPGLSAEEQAQVMLCMTNYARAVHGLGKLTPNAQLGQAATQKSIDIIGCDDFTHEACGRPFTYWVQRYGYLKGCWKAGENIAWGTGTDATVQSIFVAWLNSPEHHENILGPYKEIGIAVRDGYLEGYEGAAVWTQDFGSHKC